MPLSESDYLKGANDEYVGRLQARNRIILSFISVSAALIGIAAAQQTAGYAFVAIGVGFFSLATALLNRHHEWTIGHLTAYQRKVIAVAESRPLCEGWHNFRMKQMDDTRKHRDTAVLWIHILFCFVALGIAGVREFSSPEGTVLWTQN